MKIDNYSVEFITRKRLTKRVLRSWQKHRKCNCESGSLNDSVLENIPLDRVSVFAVAI